MSLLADTEALIVDLRYNRAGDPKLVQFLCSYLFGDKPVHLNRLYWRLMDTTQQFWTLPRDTAPCAGQEVCEQACAPAQWP